MLLSLLPLVLAAVANASPTPLAVFTPDPSQVSIKGIVYGGSGCPTGSLGSYISPVRQTFTLIFDKHVAEIGPDVPSALTRKKCQINIDLQYPGGLQYSVLDVVYRGYVGIDAGVTAVQKKLFSMSLVNQRKPPEPLPSKSPYGTTAALNINSQIRLTSSSSTAEGMITTDSTDGKVSSVVGV